TGRSRSRRPTSPNSRTRRARWRRPSAGRSPRLCPRWSSAGRAMTRDRSEVQQGEEAPAVEQTAGASVEPASEEPAAGHPVDDLDGSAEDGGDEPAFQLQLPAFEGPLDLLLQL